MAEDGPKPPETAEELLRRYAAGERDFSGAHLDGADLIGADLIGANFSDADFFGADLSDATVSRADLGRATLTATRLVGANLNSTDLSSADLRGANLFSTTLLAANLSSADLRGATLRDATLRDANLSDANLSNADLSNADLSNADLTGANLNSANLRNANLRGANLSRADLPHADLHDADLRRADLRDASLRGASLRDARLSDANLSRADLTHADLHDADLSRADLSHADLSDASFSDANLSRANLRGANLDGANLGFTFLLDTDLSPLCDAEPPVVQASPSAVDFRSIIKSLRSPNLKAFLQKTGMPEVFVEFMIDCARSLETDVVKMLQSTFISYGSPDEPFARKLYEALHRNGVTTFFFAEHAVPGDKLHRMMRKGVNEHDRVILVCSKASLDRKGVLNEIEETLAREARDGGAAYLIPIRLDGYVFSGWNPANADTAQAVRDRVVADFEGADTDQAKFDAGLLRLIGALKK